MGARLRSWWQQSIGHPVVTVVVLLFVVLAILPILIVLGYIFHWPWVGVNTDFQVQTTQPYHGGTATITEQQRTLWDWLQLLIIPLVLALGGYLFAFSMSRNERNAADRRNQAEREIAEDNQREAALQAYIDKISELLLKEHLGELTADGKLKPEYEQLHKIARVRTITVLFQLDARRIGYIFAFLRETGLMSDEPNSGIISMRGANLSMIDLSQTNISSVNLSGANLRGANLSNARLTSAELTEVSLDEANLTNANLSFANLSGASFLGANLSGANFWGADLSRARFGGADLSNANLSDANLSQADFADYKFKKMNGAGFIETRYGEANLSGANLSKANLRDASVTPEQLNTAKSLKGETMPNGSKYP